MPDVLSSLKECPQGSLALLCSLVIEILSMGTHMLDLSDLSDPSLTRVSPESQGESEKGLVTLAKLPNNRMSV